MGHTRERRMSFPPWSNLLEPPGVVVATVFRAPSIKLEPRARLCNFRIFGYSHERDCYKLLVAETGELIYSRDVTWQNP